MTDQERVLDGVKRIERLLETGRLEGVLRMALGRTQLEAQRWYTPEQFGVIVGRATYTVQGWCRSGRIRAVKCEARSGPCEMWRISHEELERFQRDGLLGPGGAGVPAVLKPKRPSGNGHAVPTD